jgi:hypothetical protein
VLPTFRQDEESFTQAETSLATFMLSGRSVARVCLGTLLDAFWRREWDSNPRVCHHLQFRKLLLSATQPSLRLFCMNDESLKAGARFELAVPSFPVQTVYLNQLG